VLAGVDFDFRSCVVGVLGREGKKVLKFKPKGGKTNTPWWRKVWKASCSSGNSYSDSGDLVWFGSKILQ
jgi:hypothetical protein